MKLELKSIQYSSFASQETPCYEAKLYLNDKPGLGFELNEQKLEKLF